MKASLFGRLEIDLGNLKSTPRLPEWRAQILMSVEPCLLIQNPNIGYIMVFYMNVSFDKAFPMGTN
jgi:hypothetical protein